MTFTPITLGSGVAGYNFLTRTRDTQQALYDQSPQVARDVQGFKDKIQNITTADQLLDDRAMLRVALGAFGLDDDINNRAFLEQVLTSDLDDSTSLANRLADKRYYALAQAFGFGGTGPGLDIPTTTNAITAQLDRLETADDLLSDPPLLRAALKSFGLESNAGDVFFLQQVLNSDLDDAGSFANGLSDTRYAAFSEVFGFGAKLKAQSGPVAQFAQTFEGQFEGLQTAQDLVDNSALFETALQMFGLENEVYRPDFMLDVLTSDLNDDASVANQQNDPRYVALAQAFDFSEPFETRGQSNAERFVNRVLALDALPETPADLFQDFRTLIATTNFFDTPVGPASTRYMQRLLESDPNDRTSLVSGLTDQRYIPFVNAFQFDPVVTPPNYPDGFAETLTQNYTERQFEIEVGNTDNAMRVALALERELNTVIDAGSTEDARWFGVMSSPALRSVFETAFGLPDSFGTIDIDLQLVEFKERADQRFGITDVADFADPEQLDALRQTYLLSQSGATGTVSSTSSAGLAVTLLSNFV